MNSRILLYSLLLLLWVGLATAIVLGFHEGILGRADASAKYIAIVICALMASFNLFRIYLINKSAKQSPRIRDTDFEQEAESLDNNLPEAR